MRLDFERHGAVKVGSSGRAVQTGRTILPATDQILFTRERATTRRNSRGEQPIQRVNPWRQRTRDDDDMTVPGGFRHRSSETAQLVLEQRAFALS
jgi:hypothetical protein